MGSILVYMQSLVILRIRNKSHHLLGRSDGRRCDGVSCNRLAFQGPQLVAVVFATIRARHDLWATEWCRQVSTTALHVIDTAYCSTTGAQDLAGVQVLYFNEYGSYRRRTCRPQIHVNRSSADVEAQILIATHSAVFVARTALSQLVNSITDSRS